MYEPIVRHKPTDNKSIESFKNTINEAGIYLDKVIQEIEFQKQFNRDFQNIEIQESLQKFTEKNGRNIF